MLTERVNKRLCGLEREEKPTSVKDGGGVGGWGTEKNRFQSPWLWDPQHMEAGSEKEEVLTGCPCGGCCLSGRRRPEDGGVCVPYRCLHTVCVLVLISVCVLSWQGLLRKRPIAPEVADIQWSVSLRVVDDSYLNRRAVTEGVLWWRAARLSPRAGLF